MPPTPLADPWPAPHATRPVRATVSVPGSKSLTNRALVLAALSDGASVVRRALRSRDTELMAEALRAIGTRVDSSGEDWKVHPGPWTAPARVDCGLAGTVMRFVPPVAALADGPVVFDGDPQARTRPMRDLLDALRQLGVTVEDEGRGALPFTVNGQGAVRGGPVTVDASSSSQFVSALLLAGARFRDGIDVRNGGGPVPSLPHIDMTVAQLRLHDVDVDDSATDRWHVEPGRVAAVDVTIEPDLSNAAPFLAAAAVSGGEVTVLDWPRRTTQAGDRIREILTALGAEAELTAEGLTVRGTGRLHGLDYDLREVGELTPVVAALCALADSPSRLRGIAHIRGHETDRLKALASEVNRLGGRVSETPDGLEIRPARLHGGVFQTYADHRMAHAGVILGVAVEGISVEQIETTSKTFPDFAAAWSRLF